MIDTVTGEVRKCYLTPDGFMVCNYVVRHGKVIRSVSGKWLRFRARVPLKKKKPPKEEVVSAKPQT